MTVARKAERRVTSEPDTPRFSERSLAQAALTRVRIADRLGLPTSPEIRELAKKAPIQS